MKTVDGPAARLGDGLEQGQPLRQALQTLHVARRILAGNAPDLAAAHVQLAIDLITPIAPRRSAYLLRSIDGGKPDAASLCDRASIRRFPRVSIEARHS